MDPNDLFETLMDENPDATELLRLFLDALKDDPKAQEVVAKEIFGDLWKQLRFLLIPAMMAPPAICRLRPSQRTSFHHQPEAQHLKSSAIHKLGRPITPSFGAKQTSNSRQCRLV
jgi:hypothetical protein